jgi:inorganic pyrophosphatase
MWHASCCFDRVGLEERMLPHQLPTFARDDVFHVVVESPRGIAVKIKFSAELGAMMWSRPLPTGMVYPFDWGFVPSTKAEDGDPLDAMIYAEAGTQSGVVVACRALGVLQVEQNVVGKPGQRQRNDRVIAAPATAPRESRLTSVTDLSERQRDELAQFFVAVTAFEGKDVKIVGWDGPSAAQALIARMAITA